MRLCKRSAWPRPHLLVAGAPPASPQRDFASQKLLRADLRGLRSQNHSATTGLHGIKLTQTLGAFPDLEGLKSRAGFCASFCAVSRLLPTVAKSTGHLIKAQMPSGGVLWRPHNGPQGTVDI